MPPPNEGKSRLVKRAFVVGVVVPGIVVLAVWVRRHGAQIDPAAYWAQMKRVDPLRVSAAIALTFACFGLRAIRWRVLLALPRDVSLGDLYAAQIVGFSSVALFGRAADLVRPYLIARMANTPVATQLAVYSIERALDLGAVGVIFSVMVLFAPPGMAHHALLVKAGLLALTGTSILLLTAVTIRWGGTRFSILVSRPLRLVSTRLAEGAGDRIRELQTGLAVITSTQAFLSAVGLSLVMWFGIAVGYLETARAFRSCPELAGFDLSSTMLLLAAGIGGSLIQIPILGWVTQIGVLAAALHELFGVPLETASVCGAVLLGTTSLCILPVGVFLAKLRKIKLKTSSYESGTSSYEAKP